MTLFKSVFIPIWEFRIGEKLFRSNCNSSNNLQIILEAWSNPAMREISWLVNIKPGFGNCYPWTLSLIILIAWIFLISWQHLSFASVITSTSGVNCVRPFQCCSGLLSFILGVFLSSLFITSSAKKHKANFIEQDHNFPLRHRYVLLQKLSSFLHIEWFPALDTVFCISTKSSIRSFYLTIGKPYYSVWESFCFLPSWFIAELVIKTSQHNCDSKSLLKYRQCYVFISSSK